MKFLTNKEMFMIEKTLQGWVICEPNDPELEPVKKAVGVDWCGVDLLYMSDGFTVGEVNSLPGFFESSTYQGEPVKLRYMRMLLQLITRKSIENKQSKQ